jgi:transposase InsO family protein
MKLYPFIEAEEQEQHPVAPACRLLEVSRSAYYAWAAHRPSPRMLTDADLTRRITRIHADSRGTYGAPRVHAELAGQGIACGRKRVARLMAAKGLVGVCPRRYKTTTIADPAADPVVDLVKRAFGPGTIELDRVYVGDITYIRTWEGWLYLATVIDLASRRVVGWSMADHMRAELVCDALDMATEHRRPPAGLIFHSDRGSQYSSGDFASLCEAHGIARSMSRPGQAWDNAVAESFFAALKNELIYRHAWRSRGEARRAIFAYIEGFFNRSRRHSSLGYLCPAAYEATRRTARKEAA